AVAAYAYGFLMNMWFWPFAIGAGTELSFVAGAPVVANLQRFVLFTLATSTLGWDTGRAITNVAAVVLLGPIVLTRLRCSGRRAAVAAPVAFEPPPGGPPPPNLEPTGRPRDHQLQQRQPPPNL